MTAAEETLPGNTQTASAGSPLIGRSGSGRSTGRSRNSAGQICSPAGPLMLGQQRAEDILNGTGSLRKSCRLPVPFPAAARSRADRIIREASVIFRCGCSSVLSSIGSLSRRRKEPAEPQEALFSAPPFSCSAASAQPAGPPLPSGFPELFCPAFPEARLTCRKKIRRERKNAVNPHHCLRLKSAAQSGYCQRSATISPMY